MKAQFVRVADVLVIGPVMVYAGIQLEKSHPVVSLILKLAGGGTVLYNGTNWAIKNRERRMAERLFHV